MELLPHEFEGVYDPHNRMSRACARLLETVGSLRSQFNQTANDLAQQRLIAEANLSATRASVEEAATTPVPGGKAAGAARLARAPGLSRTAKHANGGRAGRPTYMAPVAKRGDFIAAKRAVREVEAGERAYPGNMMLGLVAAFDTFEAELMRAAFKLRPELLTCSRKAVELADIEGLAGPKSIRAFVAELEVEDLLRASHSEQLNRLQARLGLGELNLPEAVDLVEITERRNLYAHQGGRVSAYYRKKCFKNLDLAPAAGAFLKTDAEYFDAACRTIMCAAVRLTQLTWRKLGGHSQHAGADLDLAQITYELIVEEEWDLAQRLLEFAVALKPHSSEQHALVFRINLAQAYKWAGNEARCEAVLLEVDWGAKDLGLQLSRTVLLGEFREAAGLMRDAGSTGQVHRSAFDHWPVYREFRGTPAFRKAYKKLYGEPYAASARCVEDEEATATTDAERVSAVGSFMRTLRIPLPRTGVAEPPDVNGGGPI